MNGNQNASNLFHGGGVHPNGPLDMGCVPATSTAFVCLKSKLRTFDGRGLVFCKRGTRFLLLVGRALLSVPCQSSCTPSPNHSSSLQNSSPLSCPNDGVQRLVDFRNPAFLSSIRISHPPGWIGMVQARCEESNKIGGKRGWLPGARFCLSFALSIDNASP